MYNMNSQKETIKRIQEILQDDSCLTIDPEIIVTEELIYALVESKDYYTNIPGLKGYSFRKDRPNGIPCSGNQYHWHIYQRGKECFAVNIDGTGHDGYHQVKIEKNLADFLRSQGANIPDSNIIECKFFSNKQLLSD